MRTLWLKNLMSVMTFLKLAVPRHTITSVPVGIHPRAHCTESAMVSRVLLCMHITRQSADCKRCIICSLSACAPCGAFCPQWLLCQASVSRRQHPTRVSVLLQ